MQAMRRMLKRFTRDCEGVAAVEFAMALPFLLLLLLGAMDVARAVAMNASLGHAVREGARFAAVHGADSPDPRTEDEVRAFVRDAATWLDGAGLSIQVTYSPSANSGGTVVIQASRPYDYMIGPLADLAPYELGAQASMTVH